MLNQLMLFAEATVDHATEVVTHLDGQNAEMSWSLATVLIVLSGVVGWVAWATTRKQHSFDRDVSTGGHTHTK